MYFVYNRLTTVHNCARRRSNLNHKLADIDKIYNEPCRDVTSRLVFKRSVTIWPIVHLNDGPYHRYECQNVSVCHFRPFEMKVQTVVACPVLSCDRQYQTGPLKQQKRHFSLIH